MRRILRQHIHPDERDEGEAVQRFAERATVSPRTIYRVLSGEAGSSTRPASLLLGTADRLVTAAGHHLSECRVIQAGCVVDYLEAT